MEAHSKEPNTVRSFILGLTDECGCELLRKHRVQELYLNACYVTAFLYTGLALTPEEQEVDGVPARLGNKPRKRHILGRAGCAIGVRFVAEWRTMRDDAVETEAQPYAPS